MRSITRTIAFAVLCLVAGSLHATTTWTFYWPYEISGRNVALLTDKRDPRVLWAGTWAGLWKTTDRGRSWTPVDFFDGKLVSALARDPDTPAILYAGTGWPPLEDSAGGALYRSMDDGVTWTKITSFPQGCGVQSISLAPHYGKWILVGTADNNSAVEVDRTTGAGTLQDCMDPGVRLSTDFGATWRTVLPSHIVTGAFFPQSFAVFHPTDRLKAVAYARGTSAAYHAFYSTDGGATWRDATGIPPAAYTFAIAYAPSSPDVVYATAYTPSPVTPFGQGTLFRSTDGGKTYTEVASSPIPGLGAQPHVHTLWVAPDSARIVVTGGDGAARSLTGGAGLVEITPDLLLGMPHGDFMRIVSAANYGYPSRTVYFGTDGGIFRTDDITTVSRTSGWVALSHQPSAMFYSVSFTATGSILGGMQDTGSALLDHGTTTRLSDGDVLRIEADPTDATRYYLSGPTLGSFRCTLPSATCVDIGGSLGDVHGAYAWTLDPNQPKRAFAVSTAIHRRDDVSTDTSSWVTIRPPATYFFDAVAVKPGNSNEVWAGMTTGEIYRSTDALSAMPTWSTVGVGFGGDAVRQIWFDPDDPLHVLVTGSFGHVRQTTDGGTTWADISGSGATSLPNRNNVWCITAVPHSRTVFFAGTQVGLYQTSDGGAHWSPVSGTLGRVPVRDLHWFPGSSRRLLVATHGRGLWVGDIIP